VRALRNTLTHFAGAFCRSKERLLVMAFLVFARADRSARRHRIELRTKMKESCVCENSICMSIVSPRMVIASM